MKRQDVVEARGSTPLAMALNERTKEVLISYGAK